MPHGSAVGLPWGAGAQVPALLLLLWSRLGKPCTVPRFRLMFLSHAGCPASASQLQRFCSKEQSLKDAVGREREQ